MKKILSLMAALVLAFGSVSAANADPVYTAEWELVGKNFFKKDSSKLSFDAKNKIRRIVRTNPGVEFSITGFAQFGETKNRGYLSETRALNVKRFIRDLGFDGPVEVKAAWAPAEKGSKPSARRTEIRIKELGTFSLTLNDLYLNGNWICPEGWQLFSGSVSIADLGSDLNDRLVAMDMYDNFCNENTGYTNPELEAGTYTFVLGYDQDASCEDGLLSDGDYVGNWVQACFDGNLYFYTFELDEDLTLSGPDWSSYVPN